jgi:hypothetical protein
MLRLLLFKYWLWAVLVIIAVSAIWAITQQVIHFICGRRNRDEGIPCPKCLRAAFPVDGTVTSYRCWNCRSWFEGPQHF